nr:hypothetical protein [Plasmopara viticola lesion associated mononegaambi virus 5]
MTEKQENLYGANVTSTMWDEEVEDELERARINDGAVLPAITELEKEAESIEQIIKKEETAGNQTDDAAIDRFDSEILRLIEHDHGKEVEQPATTESRVPIKKLEKPKPKRLESNRKTALINDEREHHSSDRSADDREYQESFTSQQETAEIRHHIDSLDNKMMHIETLLETIMAERSSFPKHLARHQEDMNKQLTIVLDRLHTALEKDISPNLIEQSKSDVEVLTAESDKVMNQMKTDLSVEPSASSATARSQPIAKNRRKIRVID